MNYSIQEYANDVVYAMYEACENGDVPHPNIIAESGRALSAHHSILVFNVLETAGQAFFDESVHEISDDAPEALKDLYGIYKSLSPKNLLESWHDAMQINDDTLSGFKMGDVDLQTRAMSERPALACRKVLLQLQPFPEPPGQLGRGSGVPDYADPAFGRRADD